MPANLKRILILLSLILIWGGALAITPSLAQASDLKFPIMTAGMTLLALLYLPHLRVSRALVPFLVFWLLAYLRLTQTNLYQEAAVAQVGVLLAFLLGFLRAPLAHKGLLPPLILLCVLRGFADVLTLSHLGATSFGGPDSAISYQATSFFLDKHLFGGMLILGAFLHFYLMEKLRDPHRPVQVMLYTSALLVLLMILLVDSRLVQGVFFLCFLPLLFLSVKLDGREPRFERLAWVAGITLSLGLAWINLPEIQLHKMASALEPSSPGLLPWTWASAWRTWLAAPLFGGGVGGFRFAVVPFQGVWPSQGLPSDLPILLHAQNHYLEALAEGGAVYLTLEWLLLGGAAFGLARMYYREWRLETKYAFFSLMALAMLGMFCPILEQAPARVAYWALIGYGWSFLAMGIPTRRFPPLAKALGGGALATLTCLHLVLRIPELRSDRLVLKALAAEDNDPRAFTNLLNKALLINPANEEGNYGYARVLTGFRRQADAIKMVEYVQTFAPDSKRREEALARLYSAFNRYDSTVKYASSILAWYPSHLPAMEMLMDSYAHLYRCGSVDSLRAASLALEPYYPLPPAQDYTIANLSNLFNSNREVLFVQRWFGGEALKKSYVEKRLQEYAKYSQDYARIRFLKEANCRSAQGDSAVAKPIHRRVRFLYRGWG